METYEPRTPEEASGFLAQIGQIFAPDRILTTYKTEPGRLVFRIDDRDLGEQRVIKVRPLTNESYAEVVKASRLMAHYHVPLLKSKLISPSQYILFDMPWLGFPLSEPETIEVMRQKGLTRDGVAELVEVALKDHLGFVSESGLIHSSVISAGRPDNLVYHPEVNRVYLVDAEELVVAEPDAHITLTTQMDVVQHWLLEQFPS